MKASRRISFTSLKAAPWLWKRSRRRTVHRSSQRSEHFQARVVEPTTAIVLNGAHLLVVAEEDHDFGYELMKRVAQVVIRRLQSTRKQHFSAITESPASK